MSIPGVTALAGSQIDVPVVAGDLTGLGVTSYGVVVQFDPTVLDYVSVIGCSGGVQSPGTMVRSAATAANRVGVSVASSEPFVGSGCLFSLRFNVRTGLPPGANTTLNITYAEARPDRPVTHFDGRVSNAAVAFVSLTPVSSFDVVGQTHALMVTLTQGGAPKAGATVTFEILAGPHVGLTGTGTTNSSGLATFSYSGGSRGMDLIRATVPVQTGIASPVFSTIVAETWGRTATDAAAGSLPLVPLRAFPNPFSGGTRIEWTAPGRGPTNVAIFDMRGRLVRELTLGREGSELASAWWDGTGKSGTPLARGVYFLRAGVQGHEYQSKVLLVRTMH